MVPYHVGARRNDRPLPMPPCADTSRNPAERPLPPVPAPVTQPPNLPVQSLSRFQPPSSSPAGRRGPSRTGRLSYYVCSNISHLC